MEAASVCVCVCLYMRITSAIMKARWTIHPSLLTDIAVLSIENSGALICESAVTRRGVGNESRYTAVQHCNGRRLHRESCRHIHALDDNMASHGRAQWGKVMADG